MPSPVSNPSGRPMSTTANDTSDIRCVFSASGLFRLHPPDDEGLESAVDEVVRLKPFNYAKVYLTSHDATPTDLDQWRWLLEHGRPGSWYQHPGHAAAAAVVKPLDDPRPSSLTFTRLCATAALRERPERGGASGSQDDDDDDEHDDNDHEGMLDEKRAARGEQRKTERGTLKYISVVQTGTLRYVRSQVITHPLFGTYGVPPPPSEEEDKGAQPHHIYKLVYAGSYAEATSRAFYDAGANGWSTLFTCVVRRDTRDPWGLAKDLIRVRDIEDVLDEEGTLDRYGTKKAAKIFY